MTDEREKDSEPILQASFVLAVIVAAVVAGTVAFFIVRSQRGGSSDTPSGDPSSVALAIPSAVAPEPTSRSGAADLLANKTLDAMTPAERDVLKAEVEKAYQGGAFRASSGIVPAIDIYRIDGVTRVSRQFKAGAPPETDFAVQTLVFYCDTQDGNLASFGYTIAPGNVSSNSTTLKPHTQPFDALISGLDWSQAKDLGFQTIAGHRTHGFEMPFTSPATGQTTTVRDWFDVESARIISNEQTERGDTATYTFDWSVPPPVEIPAGQPVASCAEVFYDIVPSARPPGYVPPAPGTP